MSFLGLFLVALGVSADAFAVALGKGLHMKTFDVRHAIAIAVSFGSFQALMPLVGWLLASQFARSITSVDHWVAFGLLTLIGGKMIVDAVREGPDEAEDSDTLPVRELLLLAVATSIDALAVGISFAFLPVAIGPAVVLIGVCTTVLSFAGVLLGRRAGRRSQRPAEIVGGVILIAIGTRVLLDHLGVI